MNLKDYPKNWKQISIEVRARSGGRCECVGECGLHSGLDLVDTYSGRCRELNHSKARFAKGMVFLTVAHLCHKPKCARRTHLKAMCNKCHLRYDVDHHIKTRRMNEN